MFLVNYSSRQRRILAQFNRGVSFDLMHRRKPAFFRGLIMSDSYSDGTVNPFSFSMPFIENGLHFLGGWLDACQICANSIVGAVPARIENAANISPVEATTDFPKVAGSVTMSANTWEHMTQNVQYGLSFLAVASGITSGVATRVFSETYKPLSLFLPMPKRSAKSRILSHSGHGGSVVHCDFRRTETSLFQPFCPH